MGRVSGFDQRLHAKQRALRRYGLFLTDEDLVIIVRQIQAGNSRLLEQQGRVSIRMVVYRDVECRVVYDHRSRRIRTFLPNGE